MSYLKDLKESHDILKSLAISLTLVPFWYFSIYLINREFYSNNDIVILIVMCFILSVSSVYLIVLSLESFVEPIKDKNKDNNKITAISVTSVFFLWFWKVLLLFSVYSCTLYFNETISLYSYIRIYFAPILLLYIVLSIIKIVRKKRNN